ncbi:CGNR zinc finger domain-containing protein [Bailinhaonella thermotolerans]|uniref:CGNR zinc finger domain-containing protein n=1 Tax=Bailinhaonella thermotolerans TaxID=1070861 RepID=A0A3A4AIX9_9ACTN|nr:CGNR zinc finger domain-containing protein [Bailinhaonella thermotolerans]RJL26567.1 CGNR zinc finger domain-containing protein [Bailinhaonella thermotolerans]
MRVTGYRSQGVAASAALVNAVTTRQADATDDELCALLAEHNFFIANVTADDMKAVRAWAWTLRRVFECADLDEAVALLNDLMLEVPMHPHLSDHDGRGLHMHYAPPGAKFPHRLRATTLFCLATAVSESGVQRVGVCAAPGCDRVYADTSPSGRRRFCSDACANRTNVAVFRARKRSATS